MKHLFTLAIASLAIASAHAEHTFVQKALTPIKCETVKLNAQQLDALTQKAPKAAKADDASFEAFLGDFVHSQWCLDPDSYDDWIGSNCDLHVLDNGDGTVTIKNILGYGDIQAIYDADEEALIAPGNQFLFESTYGNVGLCAFSLNSDDEVEFTDDDLLFYLDDENRFEILNDGIAMVLTDGDYAGYMLNSLYMFNQFDRVNATMTYFDFYDDEVSLGVAIDGKPEEGVVNVYGFGDVSCVTIEIQGDLASIPAGQSVFYYNGYGMFYIYSTALDFYGNFAGVNEGDAVGGYDAAAQQICFRSVCAYAPESDGIYDVFNEATITWNQQDSPVAISTIKAENHASAYDLQGRTTSKLNAGQIYFKEGQKFLVK